MVGVDLIINIVPLVGVAFGNYLRGSTQSQKLSVRSSAVPAAWSLKDVWITECLRALIKICLLVLILLATAEAAFATPDARLLTGVYRLFYSFSFVHWNMAEAIVSTVSFATWIHAFEAMDGMKCLARFRFDGHADNGLQILPDVSDWTSFFDFKHSSGVKIRAGTYYLVIIWLWHAYVRGDKRPLDTEAPSLGRFIIELGAGILLYDLIFYGVHVAMHRLPRRLQRIAGHCSVHHSQQHLRASEVLHHSFVDAFLQVAVNIIVQQRGPFGLKHALSRFTHNALITFLLTESHAGFDAPWSLHKLFPRIYGGAYRHEIHHKCGSCCFHQFFCYLDDWFGFGPQPHHLPDSWISASALKKE